MPNKHFVLLLQLNPNVSVFQRKYVNEVKKCEEMERILGELYFHVCCFSPVALPEWHYWEGFSCSFFFNLPMFCKL